MMDISIVTATHNHEKTLPKMFQSLQVQQDLFLEWIICDDGSTDDTFKIIKQYSENPKIHAYWQSSMGNRLSASLNNGLRRASGELIFIVMGDSYLQPDTLEKLHQNYVIGSAGSGFRVDVKDNGDFIKNDWRVSKETQDKIFRLITENNYSYLTGNGMIVLKKDLEKIGYWNEEYCYGYGRDDWSVFLRLDRAGVPLYQFNKVKINHIYHGEGQEDHPKHIKLFKKEYENY
jgi:glycosyltransferase involved in cell wall biosynthesis